jgi:hypothetical protein
MALRFTFVHLAEFGCKQNVCRITLEVNRLCGRFDALQTGAEGSKKELRIRGSQGLWGFKSPLATRQVNYYGPDGA